MIDIQFVRDSPGVVKEKSQQKGYEINVDRILSLDNDRRELVKQVDIIRSRRNENAAKMKGGKPEQSIIEEGKLIKAELAEKEARLQAIDLEYTDLIKKIPNMPFEDVPLGDSEDDNQVVYEWGDKPQFDFEPKNHAEIAEAKGWIDKERAAKVSGARFAYLKGDIVKLQFGLLSWITDLLTDEEKLKTIVSEFELGNVSTKPFTPVLPPLMLKTEIYDNMDRLEPREDRYKIDGEELWLQGSAEHVLGSMHSDEIFETSQMPVRYLGYATSFRKEAGTYGKDMEGIIRMHQFDKLEMESFTNSADGLKEHLFLIAIQEYILRQLKLPYRKLLKCTFDIGKPNARGVDMDVWLPGQAKYRETHTADYMTDYQARRLKTRVKTNTGLDLVHTNDATALAMGRGMVGIIENYQRMDGAVVIPEVLRSYMGNVESI